MIKFACHCGHAFEFPHEMAGKQIQCPDCGRLVDIPSTDELSHLSDDGTFLIDEKPEATNPETFEEMRRVYDKRQGDDESQDIDLRQTIEQFAAAGTEDDVFEYERLPKAPKYDPETGELIRPHEISDEPVTAKRAGQLPLGANTLNYATPKQQAALNYSPFARLFAPVNLFTMFFVFLLHMFYYMAAFSLFLSIGALLAVGPALIAHYANVVQDIGVDERDELPRLLRHFDLTDDIFFPFAYVFLAWMICFGPANLFFVVWNAHNMPAVAGEVVALGLHVVGLIFFPAVALTTITSGSFLNLRPDRVLTVIGRIGPVYGVLVILYAVAIALYALGLYCVPVSFLLLISMMPASVFIFRGPVAYGILILGIFLMHYFSWRLGLAYRKHHQEFPWIYHQRQRVLPGINAPRYSRPVRGTRARQQG